MDASSVSDKTGINHDTAARLIDVSPADLAALVRDGHVKRSDVNAYAVPVLVQGYIAYLRALADRSERHPTQKEAGEHLDLSERSIRDLEVATGLRGQPYTLSQLRIAYIRKQREEAAGRSAAGDMSLATERAGLAREQRDKIAMQNAVTRGELAPTPLLEEILANAGVRAGKLLDTIPGELRRRNPGLTAEDLAAVAEVVSKARNLAAQISLADIESDSDDDRDDDSDDDDHYSGDPPMNVN